MKLYVKAVPHHPTLVDFWQGLLAFGGNRLLLGVLFCCVLLRPLQAQTYTPLKNVGEVPADFLELNREKALSRNQAKKQYEEQNVYFLNQLLRSGQILYGDTVTHYLNQLADVILVNYPDLRTHLRFYAARVPTANAYCAEKGLVFVNVGLIAKVRTEAELAFVLCHEIGHYRAKHPLALYLSKQKDASSYQRLLDQSQYEQGLEEQADSLAWEMFSKTPYKAAAVGAAFYSQQFSDLIFPYKTIEATWKQAACLADLSISTDSLSLPKAAKSRLKKLKLPPAQTANPKSNHVFKPHFEYVQKLCRIEMCMYQVQRQKYEQAIFNALSIKNLYPEYDAYLDKLIAYSWYGLAKFGNAGRLWEVHQDYQRMQGDFARLCAFTELYPNPDFQLFVLKNIQEAYKRKPSALLDSLQKDMYKEIGQHYISAVSEGKIVLSTDSGNSARYLEVPPEFLPYLMAGFDAQGIKPQPAASAFKGQKKLLYKGFRLGIDTLVFVEPTYRRINLKARQKEEFIVSTFMQAAFIQKIVEYSASLNMQSYILFSGELKAERTDYFNRLVLLNDWFEEKRTTLDLNMVSFRHEELMSVIKRYGTPYFAWIGGQHLMHKQDPQFPWKLNNLLTFPFPEANSETFFYLFLFDLRSENYQVIYPRYVRMKDRPDVFYSIIYDMLFQIKRR